jgi:hypothetical protein|eukprot:GILK01000240.1.p10 GENE.GILK01000240.1~~GILK01000240.1.p10  ORF type:complete len:174 (-),score=10.45 GILK01000240.1:115-636(-)
MQINWKNFKQHFIINNINHFLKNKQQTIIVAHYINLKIEKKRNMKRNPLQFHIVKGSTLRASLQNTFLFKYVDLFHGNNILIILNEKDNIQNVIKEIEQIADLKCFFVFKEGNAFFIQDVEELDKLSKSFNLFFELKQVIPFDIISFTPPCLQLLENINNFFIIVSFNKADVA